MKIAFFEIQDWEKATLTEAFPNDELLFFDRPIAEADLPHLEDCAVISVFIYSALTKKVLERLPELKCIATRSTGYDHIDMGAAKDLGVTVTNVPSYGENTVAEHTFALILALSRNVHRSHVRRLRQNYSIEGLKGFDLKGKTIGVVGTGKIGKHVAKIARGFEMNIVAYDLYPDEQLAKDTGCTYVSLDDLLSRSDIVSLHLPHTSDSYHLINETNITNMKRGAILVNTARGELVDNKALLKGLDQGILAGCGLDVIEGEQLIKEEKEILYADVNPDQMSELVKNHLLLSRDNVVYTPHIAFYSEEALERILSTTIDNIRCFVSGQNQNVVEAKK